MNIFRNDIDVNEHERLFNITLGHIGRVKPKNMKMVFAAE